MSNASVASPVYKRWQLIVFAVFAVLVAALFAVFFGGAPSLLSPWILGEVATKTYHPEIHRWHDAVWGVITVFLFAASMFALLWKGYKRPLIAQFFVLAVFLFILVDLPFPGGFDPMTMIVGGAIFLLFLATYPARRELFSFRRTGSLSILLLVISVLAAIAIAPDVWRNISWQIVDKTSEHARNFHWITTAYLEVMLIVGSLFAVTKRAGWNVLAIIIGLAFFYLGIAAITVPTHPGSWGILGGVLSIIGGVAYIAATVIEMRRSTAQSTPATSIASPTLTHA